MIFYMKNALGIYRPLENEVKENPGERVKLLLRMNI